MVSFSTTGLLLPVALFPLGTTHDCAIGQAGPSIWSRLPPAILQPEVPMRRIGLAVVLALSFSLSLHVAAAQQARQETRVPRVGIILSNHPAVPDKDHWSVRAFLEGFRESGWIDGQNITIEWRGAAGQPERIPALMRELVGLPVDVIVANSFASVAE